jgi:hypothetical protein
VYGYIKLPRILAKPCQIGLAVFIGMKNGLPIIAALDDVVGISRYRKPGLSSHVITPN